MSESRLVELFAVEALERYGSGTGGGAAAAAAARTPGGLEGALNRLFQATVLRPVDADDDAFLGSLHLTVATRSLAGATRLTPWRFLEALQLELSAPFPLDLVFSPEVLASYTKLFRLLLMVRFALHCAKEAWFQVSRLRAATLPTSLLALRHHVQFFALTLQRFCLVDVMAAEFARLEARLETAESLQTVLLAHTSFLEASTTKCFVGESSQELLGTVVDLLEHSVELRQTLDHLQTSRPGPEILHKLRGLESSFHDLRRKLKLSLPEVGVGRFSAQEDFFEEWLIVWRQRCEQ